MSDTGKEYTIARDFRVVNVGLTTSFKSLAALVNGAIGTNVGAGEVLQIGLISDADFKVADDVNDSATHFRTVKADVEKVIPCGKLGDMKVASVSGTPTLTVELYYA